jgi:hypothetical protein
MALDSPIYMVGIELKGNLGQIEGQLFFYFLIYNLAILLGRTILQAMHLNYIWKQFYYLDLGILD